VWFYNLNSSTIQENYNYDIPNSPPNYVLTLLQVNCWQMGKILPLSHDSNRKEVWAKIKSCKECAFIWSIYHKTMVVIHGVSMLTFTWTPSTFTCWKINPQGSLERRLFGCIHAKNANAFELNMLNHLRCRFKVNNPWKGLKFEHCVFGKRLPSKFNIVINVWCCFWCFIRSTIWLDWSS
jgi:hypothetical protein